MSKNYNTIKYEIGGPDGAVCSITLNRPDKYNAINQEMADELIDSFQGARNDRNVKVIVLSGEGKAFCTGGDLTVFPSLADHQVLMDWMGRTGAAVQKSITENEKIVVAKVDGHCLAGGLELALCCDLIYASDRSKFGVTEINMGILPGWGGTARLARCMPIFRAREVLLLGRKDYMAQEMYEMGLLTRVFKTDEFEQRVGEIVAGLCQKQATALRMGKEVMNRSFNGIDLDSAVTIERNAITWLVYSPPIQGALAAFKAAQEKKTE